MNVASTIPGLLYLPAYVDTVAHDALLEAIDQESWQTDLRRRVQHYGYRYKYRGGAVERIGGLPAWGLGLAHRLFEDRLAPYVFDQLIVNEYEPGQGIAPHIDKLAFADTIVSISLGSFCMMEFSQKTGNAFSLLLEPRSAVIMSGDARCLWRHSIPGRKRDSWNGITLPRGRRVSMTFRKIVSPLHSQMRSDPATADGIRIRSVRWSESRTD